MTVLKKQALDRLMLSQGKSAMKEVLERHTGEKLFEKARKLCEKNGMKGWKLAQETMMKKQASSPELQEAIEYVMFKYQPDYFRPAFLSICCKVVGGKSEDTIPMGAVLTLFAWAIGIHDDVIDKSKTKNERSTVVGRFGKDLSLILSDILLFKGFTLLRKTLNPETSVDKLAMILETIENIWFEQSEGEALEIRHRGRIDITPKECLKKIRMRASEIEACARIGGTIGGGTTEQLERLGKCGRLIGMMGILRNEIVDMLELDVLGKRIRNESLPLPVVYSLQDSSINSRLVSIVKKKRLTEGDLEKISKLSDSSGSIMKTATIIDKMSRQASAYGKSFKSKELELLTTPFRINPEEWRKPLSG